MSRVQETNNMDKWLQNMEKLENATIEVGIFGDDAGDEIVLRATVNEFGANIAVTDDMRDYLAATGLPLSPKTKYIRIPERSFIRGYFDNEEREIYRTAMNLIHKVVQMEITAEECLDLLGQTMVSGIQRFLTQVKSPPNHPYTIAMKKSSNPLIDTSQMRNSITYRIK